MAVYKIIVIVFNDSLLTDISRDCFPFPEQYKTDLSALEFALDGFKYNFNRIKML